MSSHLRHRHDKLRQEPGKAWRNSISPRGWTILLACLRIDWELLGQSLGMPEAFISFQHEALSHCLETQVLQVRTSKERCLLFQHMPLCQFVGSCHLQILDDKQNLAANQRARLSRLDVRATTLATPPP